MCNTLRPKLQMFDNTRIKVDPQTAQFDVCMPKFGDLKWVMFQFPSNTRLCEAIHILLVIKLLLGVNYHHHAPPLLLYRLRSEVHPTAHPLQNTRTYKHGGRNCNFLNFKTVNMKHICIIAEGWTRGSLLTWVFNISEAYA